MHAHKGYGGLFVCLSVTNLLLLKTFMQENEHIKFFVELPRFSTKGFL